MPSRPIRREIRLRGRGDHMAIAPLERTLTRREALRLAAPKPPAQKGARVTGTIVDTVGQGFGNSFVFLYNAKTQTTWTSSDYPLVAPNGAYAVNGVSAGVRIAAFCPDPASPLAAQTFNGLPGFSPQEAQQIKATTGKTITGIDFVAHGAGRLSVTVVDVNGIGIPGVKVMVFDGAALRLTRLPALTDASGTAVLGSVPLTAKICLVGPQGYASRWLNGGTQWQDEKPVTFAAPGAAMQLSTILRPG